MSKSKSAHIYLLHPEFGGLAGSFEIVDKKEARKGIFTETSGVLPLSYLGKPALVVDVCLSDSVGITLPTTTSKLNALGDPISSDDTNIDGKMVKAVIRFEDGTVAVHSELYSADLSHRQPKFDEIQLLSVRRKHAEDFERDHASIIDQNLYIPGYASVYPVNTTLEQMEGAQGIINRVRSRTLPLLTPARILEAKYVEPYDLVLMKLRLVDGSDVLVANQFREESAQLLKDKLNVTDDSTLGRASGDLLLSVPPSLTSKELIAVQNHEILEGMSERALYYLLGRPRETNINGNERQLVYGETEFGDHTFIYLDRDGRVVHWQASQ